MHRAHACEARAAFARAGTAICGRCNSRTTLLPTFGLASPCHRRLEVAAATRRTFIPFAANGQFTHGLGSRHGFQQAQVEKLKVASNDPRAWLELLEPLLPRNFRSVQDGFGLHLQDGEEKMYRILRIVSEARRQFNIDVIHYLAIEQQRWQAMLWVARIIIDFSSQPTDSPLEAVCMATMKSTYTGRLFELTYQPFVAEPPLPHYPGARVTFEAATRGRASDVVEQDLAKESLGQIWQSLGRILLSAADKDPEESHVIVDNALHLIAHLHHRDCIPRNIYHPPPNDDPSALQQPPLIHSLSSQMLSLLSDAVFDNRHAQINGDLGFTASVKTRLGPELWLEFVLWNCIHGSWFLEGASILVDMRKRSGPSRWSLISWSEVMENPERSWDEFLQHRQERWERQNASSSAKELHEQRSEGVERTISTEVVVALINGLVTRMTGLNSADGYTVRKVIRLVTELKKILDRDRMSLGVSTWGSVIARFSEHPEIEAGSNPSLMEAVLQLAETYGRESGATNSLSSLDSPNPVSTYIFQGSAAVIGFYHRAIHAAADVRDSEMAFQLLARLQSFTDSNKNRSLQEFFAALKSKSPAIPLKQEQNLKKIFFNPYSSWPHGYFTGVAFPAFYPTIPTVVLASLMELITETREIELGRWMLYSNDIDGPIIAQRSYGNQALVPALIRFAALTNDTSLFGRLMKVQTTRISGTTLVAFCDSRIRRGDWHEASRIFELIQSYVIHEWTCVDLAMLIRTLIARIGRTRTRYALVRENAAKAAEFLQNLFQVDLGRLWDGRSPQLDSIIAVTADMSPELGSLCSKFLRPKKSYRVDLPVECFDILLDGAVKTYGCAAGKRLWDRWCRAALPVREVHLPLLDERAADPTVIPKGEQIAGREDTGVNRDETFRVVTFAGYVDAGISTLRVIAQQAIEQHRTINSEGRDAELIETPQQSQTQSEMLEWLSQEMKLGFELSPHEINYELQGYGTADSVEHGKPTQYSSETLRLWLALTGTYKNWARAQEAQLRAFVARRGQKTYISEPLPSLERRLLHCLASDCRVKCESIDGGTYQRVRLSKTSYEPILPFATLDESVRRKKFFGRRVL